MHFRERRPALEDEGFCEPRFSEQEFQRGADPKVLLDDRRPDPKSGGGFGEDVPPVLRRHSRHFIHGPLLWRFPEWRRRPSPSPSSYPAISAAAAADRTAGESVQ